MGSHMEQVMRKRVLRLREVMDKTGLCRTTIYERMAARAFPKSFPITERAVGWLNMK
jgi:prophage regulatory protein